MCRRGAAARRRRPRARVARIFADAGYLQHWGDATTLAPAGPQQPVTQVSWFAALAYCEAQGARLRVLLISLDPERDTPARLQDIAQRHRADLARWSFARSAPADVLKLAAVLGVQYRRLPDGEFNHSTVITLLDGEGRILAQTSSLARLDADFLERLRDATGLMRPRPPERK